MSILFPATISLAASLLLTALLALPVNALDSGCGQAAEEWILKLDDEKNANILRRHARMNCEFSGNYVKEYADNPVRSQRERMCNDLVLIWTHKNCGYFRDVLNPQAYEPCKAWSRRMYRHCMDNDVTWFP